MLLDRLVEYQRRKEPLPFAYKRVPVPWIVHLTTEGKLLPPLQRTSGSQRGGRDPGKEVVAPALLVPRTSGAKATLLADRADYALGFAGLEPDDKAIGATQRYHALFVDLLRQCQEATGEPAVSAVLTFLEGPENTPGNYPPELEPRDLVGFQVDEMAPESSPAVRRFWANYQSEATIGVSNANCLVCGQGGSIARAHFPIKGIPGGQTAGMALVSANLPAFESFGIPGSLGAPVCLDCMVSYTNGLNTLLADESSRVKEGDTVYIFWRQDGNPDPFASFLTAPSPDMVNNLLRSPWRGQASTLRPEELTAFYAAAVSASGARVVVRDWVETTLEHAYHNLARYFLRQRLPDAEPLSLFRLRSSLLPPRSGRGGPQADPFPVVTRWLVRCALLGDPPPDGLLYQAVRRNRAEQKVTAPRAALIKLAFLSRVPDEEIDEEGNMTTETQQAPAYLCGRLLALLEQAQATALGNPNTTLVDRFYGAASSAPASVFGLLLKNAQAHLSKLRHERQGAYNYLQRQLGEILAELPAFPNTLSLREQGQFALGYYYQRQERFRRRAGEDEPTSDSQSDSADA